MFLEDYRFTIKINNVDVVIYKTDLLKKANLWKEFRDQDLLEITETRHAYIEDTFLLCRGDAMLLIAGHNPRKIDRAVPESWFDEELKAGRDARACWSYEKEGAMGEPLYWSTVRAQVRKKITEALLELVNEPV